MAKGNDGNYLQHSIEVEIAAHLAQAGGEGRLHIALTHGMGPYEPFEQPLEEPIPGLARRLLKCALAAPESDKSPIVAAYRETGACEKHYPNSAELLRSVVGTDKLAGGITEVDCARHKKLADAWSGSCVVPVRSSWRRQVEPGGILTARDDLRTPWLFSMDPMTYIENDVEDDCRLHGADIVRPVRCVVQLRQERHARDCHYIRIRCPAQDPPPVLGLYGRTRDHWCEHLFLLAHAPRRKPQPRRLAPYEEHPITTRFPTTGNHGGTNLK